jgi:hypothetical protein
MRLLRLCWHPLVKATHISFVKMQRQTSQTHTDLLLFYFLCSLCAQTAINYPSARLGLTHVGALLKGTILYFVDNYSPCSCANKDVEIENRREKYKCICLLWRLVWTQRAKKKTPSQMGSFLYSSELSERGRRFSADERALECEIWSNTLDSLTPFHFLYLLHLPWGQIWRVCFSRLCNQINNNMGLGTRWAHAHSTN